MERVRVQSSSLASVGYDPRSRTLEVEFRNGGVYQYLDLPIEELRDFLTSRSLGRYLNTRIKPRFRCRRVRPLLPRSIGAPRARARPKAAASSNDGEATSEEKSTEKKRKSETAKTKGTGRKSTKGK